MAKAAERLYSLATRACDRFDSIEDQVDFMRRAINSNAKLRASIIDEAIEAAIRLKVHYVRHHIRTGQKMTVIHRPCTRGGKGVLMTLNTVSQSVINSWKMADGRPLGDWTGTQLLAQATVEEQQSRGLLANARFYQELGWRAGKKRVRDTMDANQVDQILKSVQKSVGTLAKVA